MKPKLIPFFERHNIPYEIEGKNVKKGNVTIRCPFCEDDPGFHLGINLDDGAYSCWRDYRHRGRNTVKLVMKLIKCSVEEAKHELGLDVLDFALAHESLQKEIMKLFELPKTLVVGMGGVDYLEYESSFHTITPTGLKTRFWNYLFDRGFSKDLEKFIETYQLKADSTGYYKDRIIIPVFMDDKLVTWTSRSIHAKAIPKYKDHPIERSVRHCKFCLGNFDTISLGGRLLLVTEGPMDMLKMDFYSPDNVHATCLFTRFITAEQELLLFSLSNFYESVILLLDNDAQFVSLNLKNKLSYIPNLRLGKLPVHVKDPGDLTYKEVKDLVERI
jgi:hypothetical protein